MTPDTAGRPSAPPPPLRGTFSPQLRWYMLLQGTVILTATLVGVVLLPFWLAFGPIWVGRYHAALRCEIGERNVVIGKGLMFRRELTIPIDKIQDISVREGPLLSALGLLRLRIETAGQSGPPGGRSDADLIGLLDARALRDRILERRDALAARGGSPADDDRAVMRDIRDALLRIEDALTACARPVEP